MERFSSENCAVTDRGKKPVTWSCRVWRSIHGITWICFAAMGGLETSPVASFCLRGSQVANESRTRNSEQTRGLALIGSGLLKDRPDMTQYGAI